MDTPELPINNAAPWLAPVSGYTDLPFRILCRKYGCRVACTEMVSAKGVLYGHTGTMDLLRTDPADSPLVVQLFGADPWIIAQAALNLQGHGFTYFDLNCGCSIKKVTKSGAGAALLRTPDRLMHIAEHLIEVAGKGNAGFKLRLGWDRYTPNYLETALELEKLGAGWITLHPRFAKQKFTGTATWSAIKELKRHLRIPVIASGDIFSVQDAAHCLNETKADTVMFARGALQDPLIFIRFQKIISSYPKEKIDFPSLTTLLEELVSLYKIWDSPNKRGLLRMRRLGPKIIRNIADASFFRKRACLCRTWEEMSALISEIESRNWCGQ